ncbi:TonB-dependent receptor plug domain-containing protein [Pedobacter arcticus]|uniref:TonB-dependent receptor plug domain-containing protein n=1 Tax=Pedobacter arcticus TaxID=752140 RepID=UPI0002E48162|nr:TonB-dependent receptor [Pedobacter arcticus]
MLFASSFYQNQKSYFGTTKYDAQQTNFYGNLQYELTYGKNSLKTGLSFRHLNLNEDIAFTDNTLQRTYAGNYLKQENIVGAFAENTALLSDKLTWIAGIRVDDHNRFGTKVTPRTLLKYDITPNTVVRANIGTGWRTANLFSENIGLLVSSRDIVFVEELKPEKALNTGVNFTQKFNGNQVSGFFSGDYYRTDFQNQIFPDYDTDPTKAIIENFTGKSTSNTFQAEVYLNFWQQLEFKTGYSFLDVYREIDGAKTLLPFNPRHKVVTTLGYKPLSNKYHFDMNIHWFGKQRLPNTQGNPPQFQRPDFSENFMLFNAQFTYKVNKFELYGGCENIFNFRQEQPIIGWQDPFSQYFDTSSVWGPTRGRELYFGVRFKIPQK